MGPLEGYKIIEIKGMGPGPYAGMLLADLGAEVIVVERSSKPGGVLMTAAQDSASRGKKSIALNLKNSAGVEALLKLVERADAIFEGFRPGVMERLGVGPNDCLLRNPKIVYGRMTGWGQTGPLSQAAGHDLNYISLIGVAALIGTRDRPVPPLNIVGDFAGGSLFLVVGILAALLEANKSGKGQVVDAAITDGSAHLMSMFYALNHVAGWRPKRESNIVDGGVPYYGVYETLDGEFFSIAPIEARFFAILVEKLELPESIIEDQNNPKRWAEIRLALTTVFRTKTLDEWVEILEGTDACVSPVLDLEQAPQHPHNVARGTFIEIDGAVQPAPAPRFSRTQSAIPTAPVAEGANTEMVLKEWGFDPVEISELHSAGALT